MKSISVVMPTFNSDRTLEACLASIRKQTYSGDLEIVVADGGSTDQTLEILKTYNCRIIRENSKNPEKAKALALQETSNELILFLASDNILPSKKWLSTIVKSLEKEPKAVAAYPWRYAVRKNDSSLNRYFAIFGVNDSVARFMGKADRQAWGSKAWRLSGQAKDKGDHWLVKFTTKNMPTLGDNGVLVWKEQLLKAKIDLEHFSHIDIFWDLINLNLNQYVVVKNTIIHDTGENFLGSLQKRCRYLTKLYLDQKNIRRFTWINTPGDQFKLSLFCIYSITLIGPLIESLIKFTQYPDPACFWHPLMVFATCFSYTTAVIRNKLKNLTSILTLT